MHTALAILLGGVAAMCWLGCIGMLRMKTPTEALHYLALPAGFGAMFLVAAVSIEEGWSSATAKMILIAVLMLAFNSVVAHATARALRVRALGHWQPSPEDGVEYLPAGSDEERR
ncbi:cation:proton antiporter [Acidipila rosea]|uniref:Multisubunit Na+/H+ antiporter MnhG subunit n=1 Tax=Acidipila rosea TaxID=768535 RepID=A0A4R1L3D9_9BACT|nr:monovalent cation/H(+) antiporter subunit G [Acidipila rosea]MBW4044379.1 monovalent cation/H(+) antiporter subunit G [Acidobacteriota bacterium]TCK72556.1 multisubunit Na+/H+ antiporter MnhG subunit [Acidipila rosea]